MNKNNRTYLLITTSLDRLDAAARSPERLTPEQAGDAAMAAVGLLDELRRLRRKWDEQAAANDPRRTPADFRAHDQWVRQWQLAVGRLLPAVAEPGVTAALRRAIASADLADAGDPP